jgi:hypothetical protein
MNERIRELAVKNAPAWMTDMSQLYPDIEKFAELIVQECLNEIESQRSNGENDDQWTITRDLCYHNMMAQLKQHFEV